MKKIKSICAVLTLLILVPTALFSQATSIGPPINGAATYEFNPCLNGNGRTIIFESSFGKADMPILEISYQKTGVWSKPEELTGAFHTITTLSSNGGFFLNNHGNILLFHSKIHGGVGKYDIWMMEKNPLGSWTPPQNIGAPINSALPETDPSISPDGKFLFFTRPSTGKTPNGSPCGKLYVSEKKETGWKPPVVLPAPINIGCECAGRMLADNKTFLFASMRDGGLGGYDIYKTTQKTDGSWEEPIPYSFINTPKDDKYAFIPASGNMIYYTGADNTGNLDIMKSKIPEKLQPNKVILIQGNVKNASKNTILIPKIIVTNISTNVTTNYVGAKDGSYTISVPQDKDIYDVGIMANDGPFTFRSLLFFPSQTPKFEEKTIPVQLSPLKPNLIIPLPNIAFVNNGDTLQPYSMPEVMRIYALLKANITTKIEIGVHTNTIKQDTIFHLGLTAKIIDTLNTTVDSTGATLYTLKTTYSSDNTVNQAKAIVNYLIKKGIPVERMIAKGYGNSQPLNPAPTDAVLNKRVELKIIQ
jgi:outer membrane protein OmpA-like peptidoglycan-associated protein